MRTILPDSRNMLSARRRSSRRAPAAALLLLFIIALAALLRTHLSAFLAVPLGGLSAARTGVASGEAAVAARFSSATDLERQNQELRQELQNAQALLADRSALYQENLALKSGFGRPDASQGGVLAAVTLHPPGTPYDTLAIDVGDDRGIMPGDLVSAGGGALVGKISEVYGASARVLLFSAPGETWEGYLRGTTAITVVGQGGGSLKAEVPAGLDAAAGDIVTLPSISANISEVVSAVDAPAGDSFKTLYLHLPVSLSALRFVEVWTSAASPAH